MYVQKWRTSDSLLKEEVKVVTPQKLHCNFLKGQVRTKMKIQSLTNHTQADGKLGEVWSSTKDFLGLHSKMQCIILLNNNESMGTCF